VGKEQKIIQEKIISATWLKWSVVLSFKIQGDIS
jgi:hypothetical protein